MTTRWEHGENKDSVAPPDDANENEVDVDTGVDLTEYRVIVSLTIKPISKTTHHTDGTQLPMVLLRRRVILAWSCILL